MKIRQQKIDGEREEEEDVGDGAEDRVQHGGNFLWKKKRRLLVRFLACTNDFMHAIFVIVNVPMNAARSHLKICVEFLCCSNWI